MKADSSRAIAASITTLVSVATLMGWLYALAA